jgi:hypothetical protein
MQASKMADDEAMVVFASATYLLLDSSEDEENEPRHRIRRVRRRRRFWMHDILKQREVSMLYL